jgi:hypothetical protein
LEFDRRNFKNSVLLKNYINVIQGNNHLSFKGGYGLIKKNTLFIGHERKISNFFLTNFNFKVWKLQEQIIIIFWHVLGQFKFFCIM